MRKTTFGSAAVLILAAVAHSETFQFETTLSGANEVPPNASPATGTVVGTYDDVANSFSFSWKITDNLIGNPGAPGAHIHMAPPGSNGGIQFAMFNGPWPLEGSATWNNLTNTHKTALFAGNLYVNFHTSSFPGGEIRGHLNEVIVPPACPGDATGDGVVNSTDLNILLAEFGCLADCAADFDDDGDTDSSDLNALLANFGNPCPL